MAKIGMRALAEEKKVAKKSSSMLERMTGVSVQGGTGPGRYPLATALSGSKVGAGLPQLAASQASVR